MSAAIPTLMSSPLILGQLGLIPHPYNEQSFGRSFVKRSTALFYKQSKYNLLRESSEGFSGLIVLLTSRDALADDSLRETEVEVRARAQRVWSKVMGLIGYFNLSPPRVLDIILEIASCHVAAHWRFWIELIRASPWGGVEKSGKGKEKAQEQWSEQECRAVGSVLQWDGDRVLAQVLGAKFGFCQASLNTLSKGDQRSDTGIATRWRRDSAGSGVYRCSPGQARLCRSCRPPSLCASSILYQTSSLLLSFHSCHD